MNLSEKLASAKSELAEIKSAVEGGDMEKAAELSAAVENVKSIEGAISAANDAAEMLKGLGGIDAKSDDAPAKTLGEFAAKRLDLSAMRSGNSKSAATGYGFKAYTDAHTAPQIITASQNVVDVARNLNIRSLFGAETISGNAITYFQMGATEKPEGGAPAAVAQGATKPQFHVAYTAVTEPLQKIAGWFYETDELLSDAPYLKSAIDNRGLWELDNAAEGYLATKLLGTSGIQSVTYQSSVGLTADPIFAGMMNIKDATGYDADAILINPADYQYLRLMKDSNDQYYGGGYFYAPYANGEVMAQPGIWGLNTVITNAVAQGTVLVGAFKAGASVINKDGEGASIEVHRGDHDDAINNRVTVVVEERLALAVRVPAAFAKITAA